MYDAIAIAGCNSLISHSTALLEAVRSQLHEAGLHTDMIHLRHLPADDLLMGTRYSEPIRQSVNRLRRPPYLIIATPSPHSAFSGVLKSYLDLLPHHAFAHKTILPIVTGPRHGLLHGIDRALDAVFTALGARTVLPTLYGAENQIRFADHQVLLAPPLRQELRAAVNGLLNDYLNQYSWITAAKKREVVFRPKPRLLSSLPR